MFVRDFTKNDREVVLQMVKLFYNSPAVESPIPVQNFADAYDEMCDGGSERLRGLLIEEEEKIAGFCTLSFSYSTEAGGPVVLLEELYISPSYRGGGLGSDFIEFLKEEYRGKAKRLRLEVAPENKRAKALYSRLGFTSLPYIQMTLENF